MTIANLQQQIKDLRQRIANWPDESAKIEENKDKLLALTDTHFHGIEADLHRLLEQCKMLATSDQDIIASHLKDLRLFVQDKFANAEKELIEIKSKMQQGQHHTKAIQAYSKA